MSLVNESATGGGGTVGFFEGKGATVNGQKIFMVH